jgi:hypothetical protein
VIFLFSLFKNKKKLKKQKKMSKLQKAQTSQGHSKHFFEFIGLRFEVDTQRVVTERVARTFLFNATLSSVTAFPHRPRRPWSRSASFSNRKFAMGQVSSCHSPHPNSLAHYNLRCTSIVVVDNNDGADRRS